MNIYTNLKGDDLMIRQMHKFKVGRRLNPPKLSNNAANSNPEQISGNYVIKIPDNMLELQYVIDFHAILSGREWPVQFF